MMIQLTLSTLRGTGPRATFVPDHAAAYLTRLPRSNRCRARATTFRGRVRVACCEGWKASSALLRWRCCSRSAQAR